MVYVDSIGPCIPNKHWPYTKSCHLIADSDTELHDFARRIKLQRAWHQKKRFSISHYNLTIYMRQKAIKFGAESIGQHEFVKRLRAVREKEMKKSKEIARRKDGAL